MELEVVKEMNIEEFKEWLKHHPDSELAIELLESWLLDENNHYGCIDLTKELARIKSQDLIKHLAIERLVECYLQANGKVMADMTSACEAYKQRMTQIERVNKAKAWKRPFIKLGTALKTVFTQSVDAIIRELEQALIELSLIRSEIHDLEKTKIASAKEANDILLKAQQECQNMYEKVRVETYTMRQEGTATIERARQQSASEITDLRKEVLRLQNEVSLLESARAEVLKEDPVRILKLLEGQEKKLQDSYGRTFWITKSMKIDDEYSSRHGQMEERPIETSEHEAMLISSLCREGDHAPVLDIDFPAELIPSSTPGHFHLYLHKRMPWDTYKRLLVALRKADIIQNEWCEMSFKREATMALKPGIDRKEVSIKAEEVKASQNEKVQDPQPRSGLSRGMRK